MDYANLIPSGFFDCESPQKETYDKLMKVSLLRIWGISEDMSDEDVQAVCEEFSSKNAQSIAMITAWLYISIKENADWLQNVDSQDRPLKLMKCKDMDRLHAEADKFFSKWKQKKNNREKLGPTSLFPGETLIVTMPNGLRWIQIKSLSALVREGKRMQNCLGDMKYDDEVINAKGQLFSLRDDDNAPQISVFFDRNGKIEYKARSNASVSLRRFADILPLLTALGKTGLWWALYAQHYKKSPLPAAEHIIERDPEAAFKYTFWIKKGPWMRAENIIMASPMQAYMYAKFILKSRWYEAENSILEDPKAAYLYAKNIIKGRWPEAESSIQTHAGSADWYASEVLGTRWPESEDVILQAPVSVYRYAHDVIKGRWIEGENSVLNDAWCGYWYCRQVIKCRSTRYEKMMLSAQDSDQEDYRMHVGTWAAYYAIEVMKTSWPAAEPLMRMRQKSWETYVSTFLNDDPNILCLDLDNPNVRFIEDDSENS